MNNMATIFGLQDKQIITDDEPVFRVDKSNGSISVVI